MKKIIAMLLSVVLLMTAAVPVLAASDGMGSEVSMSYTVGDKFIVVVNDWLNMRSSPNTDEDNVITSIPSGAIVTLSGDYGEWAYVTYGSHSGWVASRYLKEADFASTEHADILARLDQLREKFPDGKYWNRYGKAEADWDSWTETPCPSGHYLNGVQQCNGQCDGFARKLGLDLFGLSTYSWKQTSYDINTVCVGDIIRYNSKHTIMVVGFTSDPNVLIIADCNWDYHCGIRWDATFSTSRYFDTVNWVMHYPGNTLTREVMLGGVTTTTTTTTTTTAVEATTTAAETTTTTAAVTTTTTTAGRPSGSTVGKVIRLGGEDRYETATLISAEGWTSADTVIIASATSFADALAGVPLAYALDAPILLVDGKTLNARTQREIIRLGADRAYILGGTAAVSQNVADQLSANGLSTVRISGSDRFETAVEIAKWMEALGAVNSDTVYFANAYNYPDALSVSSIAAITGSPILYAPATGSVGKTTAKCAGDLGMTNAVVLGGTAAVGDDVYRSIAASGMTMSRCGGSDRYETALMICGTLDFSGKAVCFATGKNFPDALAGGVLAAKKGAPVVLVDEGADIGGIRTFVSHLAPNAAYVFGGTAVLSDALIKSCTNSAEVTPVTTTTAAATTTAAITTTTTTAATTTTTTATTTTITATTTTSAAASGEEVYHIYSDTTVYRASSSSEIFHRSGECSSMSSPIALTYAEAVTSELRPCANCCANCVYHSENE